VSEADDLLAGTDADPWEKMQLQEVLDEIDAEGYGTDGDGDEPGGYDPEGPWRDGQMAQLHEISETIGRRERSEADRVVADITDQLTRRPSTEQKIEMAIRRISQGDYLPDPYYRPQPRTADGRFGSACGHVDDLGRCGARYHAPDCGVVVTGAAATSTPDAVRAWRETVQGRTPPPGAAGAAEQMGLASPSQPEPGTADFWADILDTSEPGSYPGLHARMLAEMGEGEPPPCPQHPRVDVSYYRAALGI
jgi:hypothetical protein